MQTAPHSYSRLTLALDRFDTLLQASSSATRTLIDWLTERHGGAVAELRARVRALDAPDHDDALLRRLGVNDWHEISYRRVWLVHQGRVMSAAENWYVAARLGDTMAARLSDGATPYGSVIAPLHPTRETFLAERLWRDDESETSALPPALMRHRALVRGGDGTPLCEVNEVYTRNILM